MKFTGIKRESPAADGKKPFMVAIDTDQREVVIFGDASQTKVRAHVAEVQEKGAANVEELAGEVRTVNAKSGTGTYLAWSLPEDRRNNGGGRSPRDPIQEIVGISHYQAMNLVFEKRPPEDPDSLSAFWAKARPHIRNMAKEIAEDRIALRKELS